MKVKFYPTFSESIYRSNIGSLFSERKKKELLDEVNERRVKRGRPKKQELSKSDLVNGVKRLLKTNDNTKTRKKYLIDKECDVFIAGTVQGKYIKASTGLKISPVDFDFEHKVARKSFRFCSEFNREISKIRYNLEEAFQKHCLVKGEPSPHEVKELMLKAINGEAYNPRNPGFWEAFNEFVEEKIKNNSHKTVQRYSSLKKALSRFEKYSGVNISFNLIDEKFESEFQYFSFENLGHVNNTYAKSIRSLKTFLKWSTKRGYNENLKFESIKYKEELIDVLVLTEEEIEKLESVCLKTKKLKVVRDAFLFSILTCQRYGDIYTLRHEEIVEEKGKTYWENYQNKGSRTTKVVIPLSDKAKELISRQPGNLNLPEERVFVTPNISDFNQTLKKVCELAGIDRKITIRRNAGKSQRTTSGPKWKFITSHCGRRSGISYLLSKGIDIETVRRISGHADFRAMRPYMSLNKEFLNQKIEEAWKS